MASRHSRETRTPFRRDSTNLIAPASSPRLVAVQSTRSGVAGSVTLDDIRFVNESYWTSSGSFGLKANLISRMLLTFNLQFAIADGGLTDRLSPLVGMEWAF